MGRPLRLRMASALAGALLLGLAWAAPAHAHGGRFQGPGGRVPPGDTTAPTPSGPRRGPPVTTPGSGIPSTRGALPDVYWGTWWALNRWAYLPERGSALRARRVVTGREAEGPTPEQLTRERRALLARQHIKPFLLRMLARRTGERQDESVAAAALLALAKVDNSDATLELLLGFAEGTAGSTRLEREAAALAVGLVRRSPPAAPADAISLDLARRRLLDLVVDRGASIRTRCFAALSLGLLADQPYASPFSREGRLVVKGLMQHLEGRHGGPDLPVALMTALGMQYPEAVPGALLRDLGRVVTGANVYRRTWSPLERAHALSTVARLRGQGWLVLVLRALGDRRMPEPVQRAARLALGGCAARLGAAERLHAAETLVRTAGQAPDHLSEGLGQIALARLLHADLAAGSSAVLEQTHAERHLIGRARKSYITVRGFHVLALALAVRGLEPAGEQATKFVRAAHATLLAGFDNPRGDADMRGAYAVGLGLVPVPEGRDRLVAALRNRNSGPSLRSRAAIALAQIGAVDADVRVALREVMADTRPLAPRSAAALALSLVRQLRTAGSQREQVAAAAALGYLDDPASLPDITAVAREHSLNAEVRALAIAILGLIGDPEETPSLLRLSLDANYIARTDALGEAFTLL